MSLRHEVGSKIKMSILVSVSLFPLGVGLTYEQMTLSQRVVSYSLLKNTKGGRGTLSTCGLAIRNNDETHQERLGTCDKTGAYHRDTNDFQDVPLFLISKPVDHKTYSVPKHCLFHAELLFHSLGVPCSPCLRFWLRTARNSQELWFLFLIYAISI